MTRYCPKCGEPVPSNCLTCPKCYAKIPSEPAEPRKDAEGSQTGSKKYSIKLLLTILPGLFGFIGLGMIYENSDNMLGFKLLIVGLLLFTIGNALILTPGVFLTILGIGPMILYLLLFLYTILHAMFNVNLVFRRANQK